MMSDEDEVFEVGDYVYLIGGDYHYEGTVVSVFYKLVDTVGRMADRRYCVQDKRGIVMVHPGRVLGPKDIGEWRQIEWAIVEQRLGDDMVFPVESYEQGLALVTLDPGRWFKEAAVCRRTAAHEEFPAGGWVPLVYPLYGLSASGIPFVAPGVRETSGA